MLKREDLIESVLDEEFNRRKEMARAKKDGWVVKRGSTGWVVVAPRGFKGNDSHRFWLSGEHEFGIRADAWEFVFDTMRDIRTGQA